MATIAELRRGTDTSGRPLLSTDRFWTAWQAVLAHPRVAPFAHLVTPVQGAFMAMLGGGAPASAGYHDRAGCWDVRTWNLSDAQEQTLWETCELYGIHFWKRGPAASMGGMDEHGHALTLWDTPLASGAAYQRTQAINGRDGLASNGPDYMTRRTPVVLAYPAGLIASQEDAMADPKTQAQLDRIEKLAQDTNRGLDTFRSNEQKRDKAERDRAQARSQRAREKLAAIADQLTELANTTTDPAAKARVQAVKAAALEALDDGEEPDVNTPAKKKG